MRNLVLDGIRGWAALGVVLFHFIKEPLKGWDPWVHDTWWLFMLDGTFFVCVFFVLSGEALSTAFMRTGSLHAVDALLIKRYVRLTVPVLMSCLLVYAIVSLGLDFHVLASDALNNASWMGRFFAQVDFTLARILKYALMDVYTKHTGATSPNPFLWTMSVEMVGSLLVFVTCYAWPRLRYPFATVGVMVVWLLMMGSYYGLFFAGLLFAAKKAGQDVRKIYLPSSETGLLWLITLLIPWLCLAALHILRNQTIPVMVSCSLAIAGVFALQLNGWYQRLMTTRLSLYLGKISFPLYVVHISVLISPVSYAWAHPNLQGFLASSLSPYAVSVLGLLLCILLADLFGRLEKKLVPPLERALLQRISIPPDAHSSPDSVVKL